MAGAKRREPGPRDPDDTKTIELTEWLEATRPPITLGYARVSTKSQSLELQVERLTAAGCDRVVTETMTGAKGTPPRLAQAVAGLRAGDTLCAVKLDRLGRTMSAIVHLVDGLLERNVTVRLLDQGIAWSASTDDPMSRAMRGLLAVFAALERDLIDERLSDGRSHARQQGVRFGRKTKLDAAQLEDARALIAAGRPVAQVARRLGVGRTTLYRALEAQGGIGAVEDGRDRRRLNGRT